MILYLSYWIDIMVFDYDIIMFDYDLLWEEWVRLWISDSSIWYWNLKMKPSGEICLCEIFNEDFTKYVFPQDAEKLRVKCFWLYYKLVPWAKMTYYNRATQLTITEHFIEQYFYWGHDEPYLN